MCYLELKGELFGIERYNGLFLIKMCCLELKGAVGL
jgi:hypothetical protein